jgi:hypothetical protein
LKADEFGTMRVADFLQPIGHDQSDCIILGLIAGGMQEGEQSGVHG